MPSRFALLAVLAAIADLVAIALGWGEVRAVTKPLTAVVLAIAVFTSRGAPRTLAAGLLCAAAGDELLLHAADAAFMAGMASFVAMHLCYIAAFAKVGAGDGLVKRLPWLAVPYGAAALGMDVVLWQPAGRFAGPIAAYSVVLASMACAALNASGRVKNARAAVLLAGGALLFMGSDTLLAFAKFRPGFLLTGAPAEFAIVASYYAAQIALVTGATWSKTC